MARYIANQKDFPYPGANSIVYQRESTNPFWERRRQAAENAVPFTSLSFSAEDTTSFIRSVASAEYTKEMEFLEKFFPKNEIAAGQSLTDQFNILFQSRERYERLLERINNAKERAKTGQKNMAPNMDALYGSYLNQRLKTVIEKFRASFTATTPLQQLEGKFNQLVNEAILEATNDVAAVVTESDIYGSGKDWNEIARILNSDQYLGNEFIQNIRSAIGGENIENVLKSLVDEKQKTSGKKKKTATILRENLKLSIRTASIGGNVIENTMAALAQEITSMRGSNGSISYSASGTSIRGQMVVTDAALIFSADATIDTSQVAAKLNEFLSANSGNLDNAYDQIEKFYNDQKEKLDELYTVFINSKNYQLGGNYGTYSQHKSGKIDELDDFLSRAGVNVNITDDFLHTVYNIAAGAIYADQSSTIEAEIVSALKAAAVKFMFDDWQSIGAGNGNGIHMFLLSGKYVPSSVVFNAMADANESAVSAKAKVTIPAIDDQGGVNGTSWGGTDIEIKNTIYTHWQSEFDRISNNARWTADFVINVKRAIGL